MRSSNESIFSTIASFVCLNIITVDALRSGYVAGLNSGAFHQSTNIIRPSLAFTDSSSNPEAMFSSAFSFSTSVLQSSTSSSDEKSTVTADSNTSKKSKKRPLYSFVEARKIARGHGFGSLQEFLDYDCAGAYQLPKNADEVWSENWTSWEDFLGVPLQFSVAREVARTKVGLASQWKVSTDVEYMELMKQKVFDDGDIASRLPYRPDLKYKTKGWVSWDDFLQQPHSITTGGE